MKNILIAGGTGLVGKQLVKLLKDQGHTVNVLSRSPKGKEQFYWEPMDHKIDESCLSNVQVLINLSGAGIADKRWTEKRKQELFDSRIGTNSFLFSLKSKMPHLEHFICSSGINCYGYEDDERIHEETDPYGDDYLSRLVKSWESSATQFEETCLVTRIRTAVVLDQQGGALKKMIPAIKLGIGSPLGSGAQQMPWIHISDLIGIFSFTIEHKIGGAINATAGNRSNRDFMQAIATQLNKPFFFPNVPAFAMRLLFGEMASMLLKGVQASNQKLCSLGYEFQFSELESALKDVLTKKSN